MNDIPTDARSMRKFIKSKSADRVRLLFNKTGLSEEESELVFMRYKKKFNLNKVSYLKNTNNSSVSRKCSCAINQLVDFAIFCKKHELNLDLF